MDEYTTESAEKPMDHVSNNFPASWWNERRSRDYYVDADDCVKLRPGSETACKLKSHLVEEARRLADAILFALPPKGTA